MQARQMESYIDTTWANGLTRMVGVFASQRSMPPLPQCRCLPSREVGRRSEESVVGLGRLLRVSRQSVLRGLMLGKQVIIRNGWEAKSFW